MRVNLRTQRWQRLKFNTRVKRKTAYPRLSKLPFHADNSHLRCETIIKKSGERAAPVTHSRVHRSNTCNPMSRVSRRFLPISHTRRAFSITIRPVC